MASLSRLIAALLQKEKQDPDERKVLGIAVVRIGIATKPVVFKITKIRDNKENIYLDMVPVKQEDRP